MSRLCIAQQGVTRASETGEGDIWSKFVLSRELALMAGLTLAGGVSLGLAQCEVRSVSYLVHGTRSGVTFLYNYSYPETNLRCGGCL